MITATLIICFCMLFVIRNLDAQSVGSLAVALYGISVSTTHGKIRICHEKTEAG
jgi:hypothetical protein